MPDNEKNNNVTPDNENNAAPDTGKKEELPQITINNDEKIDNTKLKQALEKLAGENNPDNVNAVCEELVMHARLFVPGAFSKPPQKAEDGKTIIQQDTQINFQLLVAPDKTQWFIGFTDPAEMEKWRKAANVPSPVSTLVLSFSDLNAIVQKNEASSGLLVNPFSAGFRVPKEVMQRFKQQRDTRLEAEKAQRTVVVQDTKVFPERMAEALKKFYKTQKQVKSAYVRMLVSGAISNYLIVIDFEGEKQPLFDKTADIAKPFLGTYGLNIAEYETELGKKSTENTEPFYVRAEKKSIFSRKNKN